MWEVGPALPARIVVCVWCCHTSIVQSTANEVRRQVKTILVQLLRPTGTSKNEKGKPF